ncbi:MAG TPA: sarcosine oxidase subunit gamma family protein, partial [Steroidobacteraceae bacterium]
MAELAGRLAVSYEPGPWLNMKPVATRFIFRGARDAQAAAGSAFGVSLPDVACRANASGSRAALWLGPDEWLLKLRDRQGPAVMAALQAGLQGQHSAVVDVGHGNTTLLLQGPASAELLARGCPLDLHPRAF